MSALKLNLYSKAQFLIHCGNRMSFASELFKHLIISRQFLRASQIYRVYEFKISKFLYNNKFNLNICMFGRGAKCTEEFQLLLEEIQLLNQLLNVRYIDVFSYSYENADEYSAVSRIFTGHIALCLVFDCSENQLHHYKIIKQLRSQLYSLRCNTRSLLGSSSKVPHLDLIYCGVGKIENFYQIKQVLTNHRIRKLTIANEHRDSDPIFDETINDDYFIDFPVCPRIKKLDFRWTQLDETHELVFKLTRMVPFFPNLTNMECDFDAGHYTSEQFDSQKFVDWIKRECGRIKHLQRECSLTASIKLIYSFRIRRPESLKNVKQMIKHVLKTTNFNKLRLFKHDPVKTANGEELVPVRYYYSTVVEWKEPNLDVISCLQGYLNPLTLHDNEVIEDDDNLLIASP